MILAAPLVIPFAKAVGLSVGALGMAALADQVNEYIQANPEESMKILSTIIPGAGIGQIFMSKEDKISLEDLDEMTDEEAQDLSKEEKAELMKQAGKSGGPNKRQTMIDIAGKLGLSGEGKEKQDIEYDIDERYDEGGVEEVSKPKFDYKRFFRKADGGRVGLRYGGDTMGGPNDRSNRGRQDPMGGRSDFTASQIRSVDPSFRSNNQIFSGGNNLTDQTDINKKINEKVIEKLNELKPPVIDYTKQRFDNVEKFRTLRKAPIPFSPLRFDGPTNINKTLFDNTLSELALSYPDIDMTDEFGMINTENVKTVIDSAVATGKISPVEGLTLTQSITTQGDPSGIGLAYNNNLINFSTPDISQGDYTLGTNYQIGDLGVASMFDVKNDALSQKKLSFDYGDGTLTGSQVTYPGSNFQTNKLGLDKTFNVTDNIDVNVKGDLSNLKMDGSTLYTDKSLTPTVSAPVTCVAPVIVVAPTNPVAPVTLNTSKPIACRL